MLDQLDMAPTYFNKRVVALHRVPKEAWRLGLMTAEDYPAGC
jgi:hypothetical protein